jgi:hypothetical protein
MRGCHAVFNAAHPPRRMIDLPPGISGRRIMILGMSLSAFTTLHVVISLIAIVTGFIAVFGMLQSRRMAGWTAIFLWTTVLTSVTGFMFPNTNVTPGIIVGIISMVLLAIAFFALYAKHLDVAWRWVYVWTAIAALWFNVFVGIVQSFQKIAFLKALAPTGSEPPFQIAQGAALVLLVVLAIMAVRNFHPRAA